MNPHVVQTCTELVERKMGHCVESVRSRRAAAQRVPADHACRHKPEHRTLAAGVFVQGVPVRAGPGLAVGPDDNLYASTMWLRHILVLYPDTGEIIKRYGPEDGVDIPADLAFGPDGSLYASMYPGSEGDGMMRMAPDGKVTGLPVRCGSRRQTRTAPPPAFVMVVPAFGLTAHGPHPIAQTVIFEARMNPASFKDSASGSRRHTPLQSVPQCGSYFRRHHSCRRPPATMAWSAAS